MKERPILFNESMVRALLDGRKTQTRRLVKFDQSGRVALAGKCWYLDDPNAILANPLGIQGDRLWVRETWCDTRGGGFDRPAHYKADIRDPSEANDIRLSHGLPWCPSIHMPRWASRITLEVTESRIERLQGIRDGSAAAEGLACVTKDGNLFKWGIPDRDGLPGGCDVGWPWTKWNTDPRQAFQCLWNSIYGNDSEKNWDANPWVWTTCFEVVAPHTGKDADR